MLQAMSCAQRETAIREALRRGSVAFQSNHAGEMADALLRCVSLLSAPRYLAVQATSNPMTEQAKQDLRSSLQTKLRTLVVKLLGMHQMGGGLDLSDRSTRKLLQVPLSHLQFLLEKQDLQTCAGAAQWFKLAEAVKAKPRREQVLSMPKKQRRGILKTTASGVYEPDAKVKALSHVFQRPSQTKLLKCIRCDHTITSNWFFASPRLQLPVVLIPNNGHTICRKMFGTAPYAVADGSAAKRDWLPNLDICEHSKRRRFCAGCGGQYMCKHGRKKYECSRCAPSLKNQRQTKYKMG